MAEIDSNSTRSRNADDLSGFDLKYSIFIGNCSSLPSILKSQSLTRVRKE